MVCLYIFLGIIVIIVVMTIIDHFHLSIGCIDNVFRIRNTRKEMRKINDIKLSDKVKQFANIIENFIINESNYKKELSFFNYQKCISYNFIYNNCIKINIIQLLIKNESFISWSNMKPQNFIKINISIVVDNRWEDIENNFTRQEQIYLLKKAYLKIEKYYSDQVNEKLLTLKCNSHKE